MKFINKQPNFSNVLEELPRSYKVLLVIYNDVTETRQVNNEKKDTSSRLLSCIDSTVMQLAAERFAAVGIFF